jgi:hypothetical protein
MTALCRKCGLVVKGHEIHGEFIVVDPPANGAQPSPEQLAEFKRRGNAMKDMQNFDLLATAMVLHIVKEHSGGTENLEMASCANLISKVYAMRYANSADAKFDKMRDSWRDGIKAAVFPPYETGNPAATGSGSPSASPEGSGS